MKKTLSLFTIFLLGLVSSMLFTSCISFALAIASENPPIFKNDECKVPFEGTMDARFGYETLTFGMTAEEIKKAGYPIVGPSSDSNYILGERYSVDGESRVREFRHGDVNETIFYFQNKRLYKVQDVLVVKEPSLEYLHSRYGDFDETNIEDEKNQKKGIRLYSNRTCFNNTYVTLLIEINAYGKTTVTIYDIGVLLTQKGKYVNMRDFKYADTYGSSKVNDDTWYHYSYIDGKARCINYTFINQNKDGKFLIVGYKKSLVSPSFSTLRAGISWEKSSSVGTYEIKTSEGLVSKRYDYSSWNSVIPDYRFYYTQNKGESAREMLNLFLNNDSLTIRHNEEVSTLNPIGFKEAIKSAGLTIDELNYAIENEEF